MTTPAFTGEIEFKLTVRMFDESVVRKAKITYVYTPDWPHYDTTSRMERVRESMIGFGLSVLANPIPSMIRPSRSARKEPRWVRCDQLLNAGVLRRKVYDHILGHIEREAEDTDRANRVQAGIPVPELPEQI